MIVPAEQSLNLPVLRGVQCVMLTFILKRYCCYSKRVDVALHNFLEACRIQSMFAYFFLWKEGHQEMNIAKHV